MRACVCDVNGYALILSPNKRSYLTNNLSSANHSVEKLVLVCPRRCFVSLHLKRDRERKRGRGGERERMRAREKKKEEIEKKEKEV